MSVNKGRKPLKGFKELSPSISSYAELVGDDNQTATVVTPRYQKNKPNDPQETVSSVPGDMPSETVSFQGVEFERHPDPSTLVCKTYAEWAKDPQFGITNAFAKVKAELESGSLSESEANAKYANFLKHYKECCESPINWSQLDEVTMLRAFHILDQIVELAKTKLYLEESANYNKVLSKKYEDLEVINRSMLSVLNKTNEEFEKRDQLIAKQNNALADLSNQFNQAKASYSRNLALRPASLETSSGLTTTEMVLGGIAIGALAYGAYVFVKEI
jgi:hypothetical protein